MITNPYSVLDDAALKANLLALARSEREGGADMILQLLLVKERKLYVPMGYASLFAFCTDHLGFSRATAYRRKSVVDKALEVPELIDRLRDGRLQLCAAAALAPHLDRENATELLEAAKGLSHRDVEVLLMKRVVSKAKRAGPTPVPKEHTGSQPSVERAPLFALVASPSSGAGAEAQPVADDPPDYVPRTLIKPLTETASRFHATLQDRTLNNLKRAKELMSGESDDEVLNRALEALLERIAPERRHARRERKKAERAQKAASPKPKVDADKMKKPVETRRGTLADRDRATTQGGCQCSYISKNGKRCQERAFMTLDHDRPWALGGTSQAANLQPMCSVHNTYLGEKSFGPWHEHCPRQSQC